MDEFHLIELLTKHAGKSIRVGLGDDAAVFSLGESEVVISTDSMIEKIHFDDYFPPQAVGACAIEAAFSDIVAMGAQPKYCVIGLSAPTSWEQRLEEVYSGVYSALARLGAELIGGDTTKAHHGLSLNVTTIGLKSVSAQPCRRSDAQTGDLVFVSGPLGGSQAGRYCLAHGYEDYAELSQRHLKQQCRLDFVEFIAQYAHAVIDISDGLSSELHHLAQASSVAIEIEREQIPIFPECAALCEQYELALEEFVMHGGEEYELLYTIAPEHIHHARGVQIGRVLPGHGVYVKAGEVRAPLSARGWKHF